MMTRILATAGTEFRIALRNRWVAIAVVLMALFALVLSAAGCAPTGDSGRRPAVGHRGLADLAGGLSGAAGGAADVASTPSPERSSGARCR